MTCDDKPSAILDPKYPTKMLASVGPNGDPVAKPSIWLYIILLKLIYFLFLLITFKHEREFVIKRYIINFKV